MVVVVCRQNRPSIAVGLGDFLDRDDLLDLEQYNETIVGFAMPVRNDVSMPAPRAGGGSMSLAGMLRTSETESTTRPTTWLETLATMMTVNWLILDVGDAELDAQVDDRHHGAAEVHELPRM